MAIFVSHIRRIRLSELPVTEVVMSFDFIKAKDQLRLRSDENLKYKKE